MDREYINEDEIGCEMDEDFDPLTHDLDEYHADLCEEFAEELAEQKKQSNK